MGLWKQTYNGIDLYYVTEGDEVACSMYQTTDVTNIRSGKIIPGNATTFALVRPVYSSYNGVNYKKLVLRAFTTGAFSATFETYDSSQTPPTKTRTSGESSKLISGVRIHYLDATFDSSGIHQFIDNSPNPYQSGNPAWTTTLNQLANDLSESEVSTVFGNTIYTEATALSYLISHHNSAEPVVLDPDPYAEGGEAGPGGGGGDFDDTDEPFDFPPTPTISVSDSGFVSILTPSITQIRDLANYMWSGAFDPSSFKKIVANPMDVFIGMSIVPITIPSSTAKTIVLGGINTGLVMNQADSQFVDVNFGTLDVKTGIGDTYLDYSPYTKASIFLPYIGWRDLDIDEIMKKILSLKYCVDIVTGGCVAYLKCDDKVLYEWSGQCSVNIPLTSVDWSNTYSAAISAVGHIAGAVSGSVANAMNPVGVASNVFNGAASLAGDVMGAKPQYPRSGSLGGPSGVMGHQQACIAFTRPNIQRPGHQDSYVGYPSYVTKTISDLYGTGFNAFSEVKIHGVGLLDDEIAELENILKGGVYL